MFKGCLTRHIQANVVPFCCRLKAQQAVTVPEDVLGLLADLRDMLQNKMEPPVYVSDRRLVKAIALLKASVTTPAHGRASVLRGQDATKPSCDIASVQTWHVKGLNCRV